ncbi:aminomethyl-transferring glycine dehydrogenase subunit GcvPB [Schlesneria paludicola]|uniref:aminomethyl-transferring glycine dehydrogenase subunit GcvPB n=1 Tax=Schlesneria paludicola TaxID=360056 RepID=UPI00029A976D|nr:aminomethyl-transferring glycine dehydrogenase subunit GcvPB [Schlesneria paludicola]
MRNRQATQLLSELSHAGRRGAEFPSSDVPGWPLEDLIPASELAAAPPALPELAEPDVVRHFVNLSTLNMSVDTHFYPLGSCTMKYNPKRHERLSRLPGIVDIHPHQTVGNIQGLLELLYEMQEMLAEISGLPAVSLQPAAGAHGELAALFVAAAYFRDRGEKRTKVIFPASAHGTNPASAAMAGFECVELQGTSADGRRTGFVDLEELKRHVDSNTAVFMITNPNTLGLFEKDIAEIAKVVHDVGGLVYIDGANMNAIMGITRPGDFGGDMMHYNVHKTFTGPHGAGGPGSGPICVRADLADYLPGPIVHQNSDESESRQFDLITPAKSIGRVRSFFGNVGILVRGYCYLRTLGADGVRDAAEQAILNANYLKELLADVLPSEHGEHCLHEFVASADQLAKSRGVTAMDIAKRLLDYGFHPPTVYFPLVVPHAMMFEPTETESKATLDAFSDAIHKIVTEDKELLQTAPHQAPISRPEEVNATRRPVLTWPSRP